MNVVATYLIESAFDLHEVAQVMAGEQSTGTFVKLPGETESLHKHHAAKIISVKQISEVDNPSLPYGLSSNNGYRQAEVIIEYPITNFGYSLPNLITTVAGNLFELRELTGIRLIDFTVPTVFQEKYPAGRFGISGTRHLAGVHERPLFGTIIKPSVGLPKDEYRKMIREFAEAGIDFIKDDELTGNPLYFSFQDRVEIAMEEINRVAMKTGKKTMYAFNITDEIDQMRRNHDWVVQHEGTCVMVSINSVGYGAVRHLANYTELPIHGHRNQWGAMTRHPMLGMSFTAYQKICRLAGVDQLHTNGLDSKFAEPNVQVVKSINDCLAPIFADDAVMPVLSSAQWAGSAHPTYRAVGSTDLLHLAGGGIIAHPNGIRAGVDSFVESWEAAVAGIPFEQLVKESPVVRAAYEKFKK
ncbi:ribulose-bisphosphate carboxylase large subunit family protein [Chryseomicrobium palamuruense]|uniref:Ribulose-bisphosphate carboxylase large subunit family protein n=1 Tax=Chryseomicrobium palamuruense TaxID=682973 RepID=A0ABV8UUK9_9BACL